MKFLLLFIILKLYSAQDMPINVSEAYYENTEKFVTGHTESICLQSYLHVLKLSIAAKTLETSIKNLTNTTQQQMGAVFEKMETIQSTQNTIKEDLAEHKTHLTNEFEKLSSTVGTMEDVITQMNNQLATKNPPPCDEGWSFFSDSCYLFSNETLWWPEASQRCKDLHSHLVKVTSEAEHKFIGDNMEASSWIGLNDREEEGVFRWDHDMSTLDSNRSWWGEGEPDNRDERYDCVDYAKSFRRWHTYPCSSSSSSSSSSYLSYYVCEKPL